MCTDFEAGQMIAVARKVASCITMQIPVMQLTDGHQAADWTASLVACSSRLWGDESCEVDRERDRVGGLLEQ